MYYDFSTLFFGRLYVVAVIVWPLVISRVHFIFQVRTDAIVKNLTTMIFRPSYGPDVFLRTKTRNLAQCGPHRP